MGNTGTGKLRTGIPVFEILLDGYEKYRLYPRYLHHYVRIVFFFRLSRLHLKKKKRKKRHTHTKVEEAAAGLRGRLGSGRVGVRHWHLRRALRAGRALNGRLGVPLALEEPRHWGGGGGGQVGRTPDISQYLTLPGTGY